MRAVLITVLCVGFFVGMFVWYLWLRLEVEREPPGSAGQAEVSGKNYSDD